MAIPGQYRHDAYKDDGYNTPKTVYDNYCKDARAYEYCGHNYDICLTKIIDAIMKYENPGFDNYVATQSGGDGNDTYRTQSQSVDSSQDSKFMLVMT